MKGDTVTKGLRGDWCYCSGGETGGDVTGLQQSVKDLGEDGIQLVNTDFQTGGVNHVWAWCLSGPLCLVGLGVSS